MSESLGIDDVRSAAARISGHVLRTPTAVSQSLTTLLGAQATMKLELFQHAGSFKARGAFNKMLGLSSGEREAGVVTVSGGNHATALAFAAGALGLAATVVMPASAPARSVEVARAHGADVRLAPDLASAFALMNELVDSGRTLVHPFDDPAVIAGQGTVGLEFATDAPDITDVIVSVGGGGLIAGVAIAIKSVLPDARIWGVEPEGAQTMTLALEAGAPVSITPTSIVSTLSPPHVSPLALDYVKACVEDVFVVSDADAVRGTLTLAEQAKLWAEPAAGCLIPAAVDVVKRVGPDVHLGLVICGGNAATADVAKWTAQFGATAF